MFFKPLVDSLQEKDHEILCTSREYREATELARLKNLELKVVGKHGGEEKYDKLRASALRVFKLAYIVDQFKPDLAITFSSPEGSRVSFGLGIKHYCFSDSPHAMAVSKLTVPLADRLFCPWIIPYSAWTKIGLPRTRVVKYRALDPAAWLMRDYPIAKPKILERLEMEANKKNILVRLEESKAAYITECSRKKDGYLFLDSLVESAGDLANIVVICRYADQVKNVIERYGNKVSVIGSTIDGVAMINYCDLFIGAGGTMTAEACLMGKPTISIAPITFYVEKYLIRSGLLVKASKPIEVLRLARKIVTDPTRHVVQKRNANIILGKMEDPIQIVMRYIFDHQ